MERKIGEIFEYNGEWYQCVSPGLSCAYCDMNKHTCYGVGACSKGLRTDGKEVVYKKLEKVGEPFTSVGKLYQHYKVFDINNVYGDVFWCVHNYKAKTLTIEIKQNKEDMEEKEQCGDNRFEVIEKAKKHLLSSTNIESRKEEMKVLDNFLIRCWQMGWLDKYNDTKHSNSEKVGKNLSPFDLQKAREGKPVCTRDGRKARIICFDRKDVMPIVALIERIDGIEILECVHNDGKCFHYDTSNNDLMMLPEKKEGWINIYNADTTFYYVDGRGFKTKDEAIQEAKEEVEKEQREKNEYIDTIRVEWEE